MYNFRFDFRYVKNDVISYTETIMKLQRMSLFINEKFCDKIYLTVANDSKSSNLPL